MSRQLRPFFRVAIEKYTVLFILLCLPLSVAAQESDNVSQRGDALLTLVQSDALEAQVVALQENVAAGLSFQALRTRSAHHREATKNAVRYITSQFRRSERLQVSEQVFGGIRNVIATLPPRSNSTSKRIFIICAHYDTQAIRDPNWNPLSSTAPGANNKRDRCRCPAGNRVSLKSLRIRIRPRVTICGIRE